MLPTFISLLHGVLLHLTVLLTSTQSCLNDHYLVPVTITLDHSNTAFAKTEMCLNHVVYMYFRSVS